MQDAVPTQFTGGCGDIHSAGEKLPDDRQRLVQGRDRRGRYNVGHTLGIAREQQLALGYVSDQALALANRIGTDASNAPAR